MIFLYCVSGNSETYVGNTFGKHQTLIIVDENGKCASLAADSFRMEGVLLCPWKAVTSFADPACIWLGGFIPASDAEAKYRIPAIILSTG